MLKKRIDCPNQFETEIECQPAFRNRYVCERCGCTWTDEWSAQCDDDCPTCGARHMSPVLSEEVAPCACDYFGVVSVK